MKKPIYNFFILVLIILLPSCANYKVQYDSNNSDWKTKTNEYTSEKLEHTLFLIGDAGNSVDADTPTPALALLQKKLAT